MYAAFMYMKDDHMCNTQLKSGYNIQIAVAGEYTVPVDIFKDCNDVWPLEPFLKRMEEKLGFRYPSVTVDAGYKSGEGYSYLGSRNKSPISNHRCMRSGNGKLLKYFSTSDCYIKKFILTALDITLKSAYNLFRTLFTNGGQAS